MCYFLKPRSSSISYDLPKNGFPTKNLVRCGRYVDGAIHRLYHGRIIKWTQHIGFLTLTGIKYFQNGDFDEFTRFEVS